MLCQYHNNKRLEDSRGVKVKKPISKVRKPTGEAELFKAIWIVRPHVCTNCRTALGDEIRTYFFAHIKSKGAHPELRLEPKNISLMCLQCHTAYDTQGKEKFDSLSKWLN